MKIMLLFYQSVNHKLLKSKEQLTSSLYVVRVQTLKSLKQLHLLELQTVEQEKMKLKQTAEQLAEKYEDTKDKQEELAKRQDIGCRMQFTVEVMLW
jgi:hypothetical protein